MLTCEAEKQPLCCDAEKQSSELWCTYIRVSRMRTLCGSPITVTLSGCKCVQMMGHTLLKGNTIRKKRKYIDETLKSSPPEPLGLFQAKN